MTYLKHSTYLSGKRNEVRVEGALLLISLLNPMINVCRKLKLVISKTNVSTSQDKKK